MIAVMALSRFTISLFVFETVCVDIVIITDMALLSLSELISQYAGLTPLDQLIFDFDANSSKH